MARIALAALAVALLTRPAGAAFETETADSLISGLLAVAALFFGTIIVAALLALIANFWWR